MLITVTLTVEVDTEEYSEDRVRALRFAQAYVEACLKGKHLIKKVYPPQMETR